MATKFLLACAATLVVAVSAQGGIGILPVPGIAPLRPAPIGTLPLPRYEEDNVPAQYKFQYEVNDPETADIKSQQEERVDNALQGSYQFVQPDGLLRIVEYSDQGDGFNAVVRYEPTGIRVPAPIARGPLPIARGQLPIAPAFAQQPALRFGSPLAARFGPGLLV